MSSDIARGPLGSESLPLWYRAMPNLGCRWRVWSQVVRFSPYMSVTCRKELCHFWSVFFSDYVWHLQVLCWLAWLSNAFHFTPWFSTHQACTLIFSCWRMREQFRIGQAPRTLGSIPCRSGPTCFLSPPNCTMINADSRTLPFKLSATIFQVSTI